MAPYAPGTWQLGGAPSVVPDVPITAVYLALYICGAVMHMTIFQKNRRRGHKFLMSGVLFGFCMARTTTCVLRIASICVKDDVPLSIAAAIFVAAGVVLIYVINLIFAQRIIRAHHPHIGWHPLFRTFFIAIYVLIVITLIMLITTVVQSYYTLSNNTHRIDRDIQLYGGTTYAIIAFLPIPLVVFSLLIPRQAKVDKFGKGRFRTKISILLLAATLICAGASWRAGTSWVTPVPRKQPVPWYFQKVYFYVFDFTVEILVVYLYALLRVDRRFHIPNGAHGPGSYRAGASKAMDGANENENETGSRGFNFYTEEETFDGDDRTHSVASEKDKDLEAGIENEKEDRPDTAATDDTTRAPPTTTTLGNSEVDARQRSESTLVGGPSQDVLKAQESS